MADTPQRYKTRSQATVVALVGAGFCILMVGMIVSAKHAETIVFAGLCLAVTVPIGLRTVFSELAVYDHGIKVRNPFSSFELGWDEIDDFDIGRARFLPMVCVIRLKGDGKRHATAIQERTNFPDGSAQAVVDALNAELATRRAHSRL